MIIFEYLKKNRWTLLKKGSISAATLLVALSLVIGTLLLTPIGLGLIVLFSANPVGLFFLLLSGLFFLSMICSVAWLVIEQKSAALKLTSEGKPKMSDEKDEKIPLNIDEASHYSLTLSKLSNQSANKVQTDTNPSSRLEAYFKEIQAFVSEAKTAILDQVFKNPEIFNPLEEKFKHLKRKYHQLALIYHPDKSDEESAKANEEKFKQLGQYYEDTERLFKQLKNLHDEQDIWDVIREMDKTLENLDKHIKEGWEILAETRKDLEEIKNLNSQLKDLIDQGAIDTSDPEVQKQLDLFSTSFSKAPQETESHSVSLEKTNTNSSTTTLFSHTFSSFCSAKWNSIRTFFNSTENKENLNNVDNSNGSEAISAFIQPPTNQ